MDNRGTLVEVMEVFINFERSSGRNNLDTNPNPIKGSAFTENGCFFNKNL